MADGASYTKQQRSPSSTNAENKKNPSKFCGSFLFKALIITIFLVTIPLFHSDSPDFASSSIYTRGWELLHLILVGIAVSYGLFSRRNDDHLERENNSKTDVAQSYMSRLLQFPSIFDDEVDTPSGSDDNSNKFQTWSSRYQRNEPLLVVAKNGNVSVEKSRVDEKPLLLPVRSLKARISDGNDVDFVDDVDSGSSRVYARSNSMPVVKEFSNGSKRISRIDGGFVSGESSRDYRVCARSTTSPTRKDVSNDSRRVRKNGNLKTRGEVSDEFGYANENGGVSRSLSRSSSNTRGSLINSSKVSSRRYEAAGDMEEKDEENVVLPSPIPWQSRSGRFEMKGELNASMEEIEPNLSFKSQSPRSSVSYSSPSPPTNLPRPPSPSSTKKVSPSTALTSESQGKSAEDVGRKKVVYSSHLPPPPPPPPPPPRPIARSRLVKSGSTLDSKEISTHYTDSAQSAWSASNADAGFKEAKARIDVESSSVVESSKAVSADKIIAGVIQTREVEEESGRKSTGYDPMSKAFFAGFPKETRDFLEEVFVETDYDSDSEDNGNNEEPEERGENKNVEELPPNNITDQGTDEGPDVDKKADEFIAKFREQIRLQRIEEIKQSAWQLKRSSVHNPE